MVPRAGMTKPSQGQWQDRGERGWQVWADMSDVRERVWAFRRGR